MPGYNPGMALSIARVSSLILLASWLSGSPALASTFWGVAKVKSVSTTAGQTGLSNLIDGNAKTAWTQQFAPGQVVRLELKLQAPEQIKGISLESGRVPPGMEYLLETSLGGKEYWGCVSGAGPDKAFSGVQFQAMEKKAYADRVRFTLRSRDRYRSSLVQLNEIRIYVED